MIKKIILIISTILLLINFGYSFSQDSFDYIGTYHDAQANINKVHYELKNFEDDKYFFELVIYFNNQKIDSSCTKEILIGEKDSRIFKKITCNIPQSEDGEYTFDATLLDENKNVLKNVVNKEFISSHSTTNMEFVEDGDKTTIIIKIDTNKSVTVTNRIPKSVIELLNEDNKNSLIQSNIDYVILEEDPLIAWNIEEPPKTINYTINKKISKDEQKQFTLDIKENKTFQYLKYTLLLLILLIIGLLLKPVLKKK